MTHKLVLPKDAPLYDKLVELKQKHLDMEESLYLCLTDAANSIIEKDYLKVGRYLNGILHYQYEFTLDLLAALYMYKCDTGEWE